MTWHFSFGSIVLYCLHSAVQHVSAGPSDLRCLETSVSLCSCLCLWISVRPPCERWYLRLQYVISLVKQVVFCCPAFQLLLCGGQREAILTAAGTTQQAGIATRGLQLEATRYRFFIAYRFDWAWTWTCM
ncbi:hypothetical protein BKA64DRAFT_192798 [Cadophora sp. MPI-SDFR-AT-0126]|nr:hypothetical protein BKA64DRAFT_192798 [Leotiomycetes sp. MPI-SDFR-AT-0126]